MILQYRDTRKLESKLPKYGLKKKAQYRNIVNPNVPLHVHGRNYERKKKNAKV